ncbi:retrovirus-related pol polyprotein from transposon TNT 1-94 [Tanacetum coccineum]
MATVEVPQTLEYRGGQLNAALVLEVENFTNWKKRFMCHILGIESQFENIIKNGPFIPMTAGQRKPEGQWSGDERKDIQDSPDDEEDKRSSHDYLNELEEEYQAKALLAKSKRFFKKGTQRPTKDFEAKYNKVKAKLALLSLSALDSKAATVKNKGLIAEAYEWDEEEVSSDDNEMVEVKVLMALAEENDAISKEGARKTYLDYLILPAESQRNTNDSSVAVTDSLATDYDSADESSVCRTPLPPLKKLDGAEPISGPKTIKSILRLKSTFKVETLKGVIINEPSSAPAKGNKSSSALKVNSAPAGKLKSVKTQDDHPLAICDIRKPIWYLDSGCSRHMTGVKSYLHKYVEQPGPKVVFGDDSTCTTEGYGSIKCNGIVFTKVAFVNGLKYNLISISQLCDAKYIVQFDEKRGTIFNSNKEVVMIAPRVRDVYVLDMTSFAQESCFFAKASDNLNWLWHKRLAHLNFKTINKLAKQNLVIGLPSLVYSKDKPCSSCEKGKRHRANFKTKQTSSIKKCLYLFHIDLFGPVTPRSINHEKYTLVIVDEYSRYTWVYFLKKKSQAPETIMSFTKRVENQNDIKVKQHRTDNGTKFRNSILVNLCDEKGISQNFSSPYTPEQNGVVERKNRTLIEAARTMLSGSVFSKQYWTERLPLHAVLNTRRQQTEETYHITFDESPDAIKFSKPSVNNINIAENERYQLDEYLKDGLRTSTLSWSISLVIKELECSQEPWPKNLV